MTNPLALTVRAEHGDLPRVGVVNRLTDGVTLRQRAVGAWVVAFGRCWSLTWI